MKIGIFGAGIAGLSAGYHLGNFPYTVFEAESRVGGHAGSVSIKGFTFDYGPHILYSKDDYFKGFLKELMGPNILFNGTRRNYVYVKGRYIPFPFEANLYKAPRDVAEECVVGALRRVPGAASNFAEWTERTFGVGVAKHYMLPYNRKLWKYEPKNMSLEWIADRVVTPSLEDIVRGAIRAKKKAFGPNARFWYPKFGGMASISTALSKRVSNIRLSDRVKRVRVRNGRIHVTAQKQHEFDFVLSSIPLPDLIGILDDVPTHVEKAARSLVFNSLCSVFVGLNSDALPRWTAAYFPEPAINFHRLSFPRLFSPYAVPAGKSSINIEITHKQGERVDRTNDAEEALEGLREVGLVGRNQKPLFVRTLTSKYAYVVYDLAHRNNTKIIHEFLRSRLIIPMGRFGEWEYFNTDHAFLSGKRAATAVPRTNSESNGTTR